jgi:hypothetical protein
MLSPLRKIFLRPSILSEIDETHTGVRRDYQKYFSEREIEPTLLSFLIQPTNRNLGADATVLEDIEKQMLSQEVGKLDLKQYGIYCAPRDFAVVTSRHQMVKLLQSCGQEAFLLNPKPKAQHLSENSLCAYSHSTLLAIKYFWLYLDYPLKGYTGLPAHTGPCKKATEVLWGSKFVSFTEAKTFTTQLAMELKISEIEANTALWVLGMKMS